MEKVKIKKEKEDNSFWGGEKPYVEEKRSVHLVNKQSGVYIVKKFQPCPGWGEGG